MLHRSLPVLCLWGHVQKEDLKTHRCTHILMARFQKSNLFLNSQTESELSKGFTLQPLSQGTILEVNKEKKPETIRILNVKVITRTEQGRRAKEQVTQRKVRFISDTQQKGTLDDRRCRITHSWDIRYLAKETTTVRCPDRLKATLLSTTKVLI